MLLCVHTIWGMITQAETLSQVNIWFKFTRLWEVTNANASRRAVVPISDAEHNSVDLYYP